MEKKTNKNDELSSIIEYLVPVLQQLQKKAVAYNFSTLDMMRLVAFIFIYLLNPMQEEIVRYTLALKNLIKNEYGSLAAHVNNNVN